MIKKCDSCGHIPHTQDTLHGKGNRVFNEINRATQTERKCTVCGKSEVISKGK